MDEEDITTLFPRLSEEGFEITSPEDERYNCIAWAAGDSTRWWWPGISGQMIGGLYWPKLTPGASIDAFVEAFSGLGYERCNSSDYESGFEKVAIYIGTDGVPTHAARQIDDGSWVSKLGRCEDIKHNSIDGVCGEQYGRVALVMRRSKD